MTTTTSDGQPVEPHEAVDVIARIRSLEPLIRSLEDRIDRERTIPTELAEALWDVGALRAQLPRQLGGLELHPVEYLAMAEELAYLNGSLGWLMFPNSGQTFASFRPDLAQRIFATERRPTIGGCNGRNGKAVAVRGGYLIDGQWPFASGSPHCTWLFATAVVHDGDQARTKADGTPVVKTFFFPQTCATLLDTWHSLGMRGTGSHDFEAHDLFIPEEYVTDTIFDGYKYYSSPIYRAHFVPLAQAAVALGITRAAADDFIALANSGGTKSPRALAVKGRPLNQLALAEAEGTYRSSRLWLHAAARRVFDAGLAQTEIPRELLTEMQHANVHTIQACARAVEGLWEAAGPSAVYQGRVIERCFRDIQTSRQHMFAQRINLEPIGAQYFDIPLHQSI
jgi:alkylation response protein AidB-like acyl-CoA dehydrogenase